MSCNNSINIFLLGLISNMTPDSRASSIDQQPIMIFAEAFSVTLLVVFAILSNISSIDTFRQAQIRTSTLGFYRISHGCCSIFGILMLEGRLIQMLNSFCYAASFLIFTLTHCLILTSITRRKAILHQFLSNYINYGRSFCSYYLI
jgi:hypothetical protein